MKNKKVKSNIFHHNFFSKSRKGSVEIVVFVFLVVALVLFAGYKFYTNSGKVEANITDARFVRSLYSEQKIAGNYIEKIGEDVMARNSEKDFSESFKEEFGRYSFDDEYLKNLKKIISEDKFSVREFESAPKGVPSVEGDVNTEGKILEIVVESWELNDLSGKINVKYTPKISVKFDLKQKV